MVGQQITCPVCANTFAIPAPQPVAAEVTRLHPTPAGNDQSLLTAAATSEVKHADSAVRAPKRRTPVLALAAVFVALGLAAAFFMFRGKGGGSLSVLSSLTGPPPSELRVYPTNVNLTTKGDRQSLVV